MTFSDWVRNTATNVRERPVWGTKKAGSELVVGALRRIEPFRTRGVNVFDREWDVCLVLDACRTDLMAEVADEYDWFEYEEDVWSLGATSPEWIERTYERTAPEKLARSGYVTWNAWSERYVDESSVAVLDEVWRYGWDDDVGALPPRNVTDRTIDVWRTHDLDRLVVHYMQPHVPFIASDVSDGFSFDLDEFHESRRRTIWHELEDGNVTYEEVWDAYVDNLRLVLDDIELLVENVDADRIVITSDHGNAMGEFEQYGHERNQPLRCLHEVPWCVTSGTDERTYEPELKPGESNDGDDVAKERLEELGYL